MCSEEGKTGNVKKGRLWLFLTIAIFALIIYFNTIGHPAFINARRNPWEARAKTTLKTFGETQLAYMNTNSARAYGSWEGLKASGYVTEGYTRGNIIDNYSLYTSVDNFFLVPDSGIEGRIQSVSTFTAVAFPRTTSPPGYLSTFVVREDQVLRIYRPGKRDVKAWGEDDDFGARTWEEVK